MKVNNLRKPKVTVLMPVYNGEKYVREAIESILNQTFTDFEFLIINDGSTDNSEEIIKSYKDPRIRSIKNEKNLGIIKTLNKGLGLAQGRYIARMDADDVSLPNRLETQVKFMDKHPEIGLLGAWARILGRKDLMKRLSNPDKIRANLLFGTSMIHPTILIDKDKFEKYNLKYDENYKHSEDYELWTRASKHFPISNINKVLLLYRIHDSNTGTLNLGTLKQASTKIRRNLLVNNLKIELSDEDLIIRRKIHKPEKIKIIEFLNNKEEWFNKLIEQNNKTKFYKEPEFSQVLAQRWLRICSINSNNNWKIWKKFWKSNLRKKIDIGELGNWNLIIRFFIKCLLKKTK